MVYAKVVKVWKGGINSLTDPSLDQPDIYYSKEKDLTGTGVAEREKVNFTIKYDVTDLKYAANISIASILDRSNPIVFQTNLKSVQGAATMTFSTPILPKYTDIVHRQTGVHELEIIVKVRPRWSVWHLVDNYQDWSELSAVAESSTIRRIIITE